MKDIVVKGLTMDSRQVKPGDLFMAVRGLTVDGRDYIQQAVQNGAIAVLAEAPLAEQFASPIPIIPVSQLKKLIGPIAAGFFSHPSQSLSMVGITGTNGKTSIAHFIAQIYAYCHRSCGIIGTLGVGFLDQLQVMGGTTPDAIAVQRILAELKSKGAELVAMEVTSHALDQGRVDGVQFHTTVFSNLTRDHLDYHRDLEHYAATKRKLFVEYKSLYSIINVEDEFGEKLIQDSRLYQFNRQVIGYTTHEPSKKISVPSIVCQQVVLNHTGINAILKTPWGEGELQCALLGRFNLSNILAALAVVCAQGIPLPQVLEAIKTLKTVPGRMMRLGGKKGTPMVIIDYAHTPDALAKILKSLRQHSQGTLWCIFGCGGDRDRGKRPLMATIAEQLSDKVCLTEDNPRTEDPSQIFNDMLQGIQDKQKIMIEPNRKQAIAAVITAAKAEDLIVVAGKGHEEFQIVGKEHIPYSDRLEVEAALRRKVGC